MSTSLLPELLGDRGGINLECGPPSFLVTPGVQGAMVQAAERHRELVADLPAQSAWLREAQVMCVRGLPAAHQAGLRGHKGQVVLVPASPRLAIGQLGTHNRIGRELGRILLGGAAALIRSLQALPLCLKRLLDRAGVLGRERVLDRQTPVCPGQQGILIRKAGDLGL